MVLTPDAERSRPRFPIDRACATLAGALYLIVAFLAVVKSQSGLEPNYVIPAVIAAFPICAFLALRYPMIFPFGLYVALVPFDSLLQVSGGGATLGRFVAIATAGTMILHALLLRRAFVPHRAWTFWAAMVVYMSASLLWTSDPGNGGSIMSSVVQLFLFMTILAMYPATKTEFTIALCFVIGCGVLAALYAVQQYQSGNIASDSRVVLSLGSAYAIDSNYFGASFILPISIGTCFIFYAKSLLGKLASGLATLVMFAGLLVTGSRGAFLAALAIFVFFAVRSKYKIQAAVFLALAGSVTLLFPSVYARFANDPSGQQGSASGRTFIWQTGLYSLRDHIFFGTGAGSFSDTYDRNFLHVYQAAFQGWSRPSHSILVGGLTELGIVGLLFVLAAWFVSFRQLKIIPRTSEWFGLRLAFEGAIIALFAMSLSIDPTYIKYVWLAHSMALMLLNQAVPRAMRLERTPLRGLVPLIPRRPSVERGATARVR
jgi:O-antigen ligase